MHVVATAGHVDHGKSTLVRALTGMEPDRYAEERRRGMTIDLGYAWTTVPGVGPGAAGAGTAAGPGTESLTVAFVDVPGHERFIGTMLAGLGPAPAVMFVVAADEGWRRQSVEHLAAVDALGLRHGLLVVTRSDLADPAPAAAQAQERIAASSLGAVPTVSVSGRTGAGLGELRSALAGLVTQLPAAPTDGRVRLWVDRAFTIRGAGTVVTGTLGSGSLRVGDALQLGGRTVRIRGLQSLGTDHREVSAVARVAVNLRGVEVEEAGRGDALLTPGAWPITATVDVRVAADGGAADLPTELVLHAGTAAVPVRVRPLGDAAARLTLRRALPLEPGDRLVLRDPSRHAVAAGAIVLDTAPPALRRRGAAADRARTLEGVEQADPADVLVEQVRRRGAVRRAELESLGVRTDRDDRVQASGEWLVDREVWQHWQAAVVAGVDEQARRQPLEPRLTLEAARRLVQAPERELVLAAARAAGLDHADGRIFRPGAGGDLGAAETGLAELVAHLGTAPFLAPEKPDLDRWRLGVAELAAAERTGRVVRLAPDVVLLPTGPAQAMRVLAGLPQPFTTSEARQALGTTRRVAIPLLEHLDGRGWTVRLDSGHRRVKGR